METENTTTEVAIDPNKVWIPKHSSIGKANYSLCESLREKNRIGIDRYLQSNEFDTTERIILEHTVEQESQEPST